MSVIILHPDEKLKFINLSKIICKKLMIFDFSVYKVMPFWIFLEDFKGELKDFSKKIKNVEIEFPKLIKTKDEKYKIISCVKIDFCQKKIETQLEMIHFLKNKIDEKKVNEILFKIKNELENDSKNQMIFPRKQKIFRIGNEKKLSENSFCITQSIWCKIK